MKAFLAACIICAAIALGAYQVLETQQIASADQFRTQSVRL